MSEQQSLLIGAVSMMTPLGDTVELVDTSVSAGISRYRYTDIHGTEDNPTRMAVAPIKILRRALSRAVIGNLTLREMRVLRLAVLALNSMLEKLPKDPLPLFLSGPETYIGEPVVNSNFIQNLAEQTGANIDIPNSRFVNIGRAGALDVIETAFKYLSGTNNYFALVGGVDSFYDMAIMQYLDDRFRLAKPDTIDGFVPGEGAGFLLLVSPNAPAEIKQGLNIMLGCPGISFDDGHLMGDEDYRGEGLSAALAASLNDESRNISRIYSCENGEMHYAKELGVALMRHKKMIQDNCEIVRPAECFGDLGAAFGSVALGLASTHLKSGESTLVNCSSDSGLRASVCMSLA